MPFAQRLKATLKNKYFIVLTLTMMAVALYQNVNGTVATYYAQYMLNNVEIMGVMQSFENIPKIIAIICLAPFIKKFGKQSCGKILGPQGVRRSHGAAAPLPDPDLRNGPGRQNGPRRSRTEQRARDSR